MNELIDLTRNCTLSKGYNKDVLYSYRTAVACYVHGKGYYVDRTYINYSDATTQHINKFIQEINGDMVTETYIPLTHSAFTGLINGLFDAYFVNDAKLHTVLGVV